MYIKALTLAHYHDCQTTAVHKSYWLTG